MPPPSCGNMHIPPNVIANSTATTMIINNATSHDVFTIIETVKNYAKEKKIIFGLTEPYLSYFLSDNFKTQVNEIFLNPKDAIQREDDIILIAKNDIGKIVGYISGGYSLDNDDYDGEVYLLFTFLEDKDQRIRDSLFYAFLAEIKKLNCKSVHVEITKNDLNISFYLDKEAEFITEITNMTKPPYKTNDYGWSDIHSIK